MLQTPFEQTCPGPQAREQTPQFALSVLRSTQRPLQTSVPGGQTRVQVLLMHCCPRPHCTPQRPQCTGLFRVSISQPSTAIALQFAKPALQEASAHDPARQVAAAFGKLQNPPQRPQCVSLLLRLVSQPLVVMPSQF